MNEGLTVKKYFMSWTICTYSNQAGQKVMQFRGALSQQFVSCCRLQIKAVLCDLRNKL